MTDPFQARVAQLALAAAAGQGIAFASGNALVAHGLLTRPTQDADLYTPEPGGPGHVLHPVGGCLGERRLRRPRDASPSRERR